MSPWSGHDGLTEFTILAVGTLPCALESFEAFNFPRELIASSGSWDLTYNSVITVNHAPLFVPCLEVLIIPLLRTTGVFTRYTESRQI